jgi:hypothetical protein
VFKTNKFIHSFIFVNINEQIHSLTITNIFFLIDKSMYVLKGNKHYYIILYRDRVKIGGYRHIDLLHKNGYIDNGHIDCDVIVMHQIFDSSKNGRRRR